MGEEEQTLSLVMEEREPARSEEAEAEEPYAEVTGETGVVEGVVVEEAPLTNETLRDWVKRWCGGEKKGLPHISTWNTSKVTDMSSLFHCDDGFNDDISAWDTSSVTTMRNMFNGAKAFNQPIGEWRVDNVTRMDGMFRRASSFDQPLGTWRLRANCKTLAMFEASNFQNSRPVKASCCSIS